VYPAGRGGFLYASPAGDLKKRLIKTGQKIADYVMKETLKTGLL